MRYINCYGLDEKEIDFGFCDIGFDISQKHIFGIFKY